MNISFFSLMGIIGGLSAINLLIVNAQKKSKARTLGLWFNGLLLGLVATAVIVAVVIQ